MDAAKPQVDVDAATADADLVSTSRHAFDLSGRRAVVTGAARGIGRAAATALARHGAEVVLVDVLAQELAITADEVGRFGATPLVVRTDVRSADDVQRLAEAAAGLGGTDIVVNCAGVLSRVVATEGTLEDLDRLWDVNVRGLYAVTQAFLPQLIERRRGKIINVGSLGSVLGLKGRAAYAATKGAVSQYTRSLAVELGAFGLCANTIAPGYIETNMSRDWLAASPDRRKRMLERIPVGRFGDTADVEGTFVFLAAPASDYVTGQMIIVDGGWSSW